MDFFLKNCHLKMQEKQLRGSKSTKMWSKIGRNWPKFREKLAENYEISVNLSEIFFDNKNFQISCFNIYVTLGLSYVGSDRFNKYFENLSLTSIFFS